MEADQYILAIENVLKRIPKLEQELEKVKCPERQKSLERSLKFQRKRFERMIPYQHRRTLSNLCCQLGIKGDFF